MKEVLVEQPRQGEHRLDVQSLIDTGTSTFGEIYFKKVLDDPDLGQTFTFLKKIDQMGNVMVLTQATKYGLNGEKEMGHVEIAEYDWRYAKEVLHENFLYEGPYTVRDEDKVWKGRTTDFGVAGKPESSSSSDAFERLKEEFETKLAGEDTWEFDPAINKLRLKNPIQPAPVAQASNEEAPEPEIQADEANIDAEQRLLSLLGEDHMPAPSEARDLGPGMAVVAATLIEREDEAAAEPIAQAPAEVIPEPVVEEHAKANGEDIEIVASAAPIVPEPEAAPAEAEGVSEVPNTQFTIELAALEGIIPDDLKKQIEDAQREVREYKRREEVAKRGGRLSPDEAWDADEHTAAEAKLNGSINVAAILIANILHEAGGKDARIAELEIQLREAGEEVILVQSDNAYLEGDNRELVQKIADLEKELLALVLVDGAMSDRVKMYLKDIENAPKGEGSTKDPVIAAAEIKTNGSNGMGNGNGHESGNGLGDKKDLQALEIAKTGEADGDKLPFKLRTPLRDQWALDLPRRVVGDDINLEIAAFFDKFDPESYDEDELLAGLRNILKTHRGFTKAELAKVSVKPPTRSVKIKV